jgi:tRNA/rRNA methyltransferase
MLHSSLLSRLSVVLVRTRNPLNIGAAARAMSNFGFERLRVVSPYEVAFREARSAVGAAEILVRAEEYKSLPEAIADCELVVGTTAGKQRELHQRLVALDEAAEIIGKQAGRIALVFGSEKRGLSNEDFSYCHWLLRIPTAELQPSINLGQAVAVCLYELGRSHSPISEREHTLLAASRQLDLITDLLATALYERGYMTADARPSTEEKLRRLVHRLKLSVDDAQLLLGVIRHLARKPCALEHSGNN